MDCVICMQKIKDKVSTPCNHEYCRECILQWILKKHVARARELADTHESCAQTRAERANLFQHVPANMLMHVAYDVPYPCAACTCTYTS